MAQTDHEQEKDQAEEPEFRPRQDVEECQAALAGARREAEELKDKYLRAAAQVENVRKWTERDVRTREKEDKRRLLRQLLEVMDDLDRALAYPNEPDALYRGVTLTRMQLEKVLAQAGVERMQVEPNQPFNPAFHQAVEVRQVDSGQPIVASVVQPGYTHENELLRPASVVVHK